MLPVAFSCVIIFLSTSVSFQWRFQVRRRRRGPNTAATFFHFLATMRLLCNAPPHRLSPPQDAALAAFNPPPLPGCRTPSPWWLKLPLPAGHSWLLNPSSPVGPSGLLNPFWPDGNGLLKPLPSPRRPILVAEPRLCGLLNPHRPCPLVRPLLSTFP